MTKRSSYNAVIKDTFRGGGWGVNDGVEKKKVESVLPQPVRDEDQGPVISSASEQRAPVLEGSLTLSQLLYLSKLICNHICFKRTIHITVNA